MFGRLKKKEEEVKSKSINTVEPSNSLVIKILNDDSNECSSELGITETRSRELHKICVEALENFYKRGRVVVMSEISQKIVHVNELYLCMLITEKIIQVTTGISSDGPNLADLLTKLLGGDKD